jgi:hypothetical protein
VKSVTPERAPRRRRSGMVRSSREFRDYRLGGLAGPKGWVESVGPRSPSPEFAAAHIMGGAWHRRGQRRNAVPAKAWEFLGPSGGDDAATPPQRPPPKPTPPGLVRGPSARPPEPLAVLGSLLPAAAVSWAWVAACCPGATVAAGLHRPPTRATAISEMGHERPCAVQKDRGKLPRGQTQPIPMRPGPR